MTPHILGLGGFKFLSCTALKVAISALSRTHPAAAIKPDRATAGVTHVGEGPADCIPVLYVNGTWWGLIDEACDSGPDGKFVPSDIEAIEIYNHPSVLPDQFNSGREAQECGVVVLWRIGRQ